MRSPATPPLHLVLLRLDPGALSCAQPHPFCFTAGQACWLFYSIGHGSIGGSILYTLLITSTARTGYILFRQARARPANI